MFYVDKSFADEGAIEDAPGEKLSPFRPDEVGRILESGSADDPSGWERTLLEVLFFTGMRLEARRSACDGRTSSSTAE